MDEFEVNPRLFDAVVSISSYEHDGLGRYGDPINPDGDLIAMEKTKKMLKEDGLFRKGSISVECAPYLRTFALESPPAWMGGGGLFRFFS